MKFVPFEKMQKQKQKVINARRRRDFGEINPVSRVSKNPRVYDRKQVRRKSKEADYSVKE